jgi:beta-mannosidase
VPGNVELDLLRAGRIEDPSVGDRIYRLRELETYRWWYRRGFAAPALARGERAELVFEGLDCLGAVWLNGSEVGRCDNMLIAHRFDVTSLLRRGGPNELAVRIDSPILAACPVADRMDERRPDAPQPLPRRPAAVLPAGLCRLDGRDALAGRHLGGGPCGRSNATRRLTDASRPLHPEMGL